MISLTTIRILIVEDRFEDAELVVYELRRMGIPFEWERVDTEETYLERLETQPDVILGDYTLPTLGALRALELLRERGLDIPFIVVTGSVGEEEAVECIKQGAADYLLKDRLTRLGPAVLQTLEDKRLREEKRQADVALREAELLRVEVEKEREFLTLKERFLSMVSHEFRTPLTVMMTSMQLLTRYREKLPEEKKATYFQQIESQIHYMTDLLNDVLALTKARAGRLPFVPAILNMEAFCRNLFELLQMADNEQHTFVFRSEGNFERVMADEKLLRHVFVNLISNAIKYTPPGKTVRFEMKREADTGIFYIRDEGIGIPEKDQKRLFEPFHRAANTGVIEGTGLGLAIVKSNVEAHGGTIICTSEEEIGTTFEVRLPLV